MHVNGKMISVETIPGMRERGKRRMVEGVNSSMIQSICCKNFYKCHNVPPPSTIKNERKKERKKGETWLCSVPEHKCIPFNT
jgi:hypothetical protein